MPSTVWAFICGDDAGPPPIWDASQQNLHRCWRAAFYCFFCAALFVCTAYNVGIIVNLRLRRSLRHVNGGVVEQDNSSWLWSPFLIIRTLLNVLVAAVFATEGVAILKQSATPNTFSIGAIFMASVCFAAGALVDLCSVSLKPVRVLTTVAYTTQIILWLPVYVLTVLDFCYAVSKNFTGAPWLRVCFITMFALQTLLLISHLTLVLVKRRCLHQAATYSRMLADADSVNDGTAGIPLDDRLGKAEDGLGRGVLSFVLFLWVNPLIKLGSAKPLDSYEQLFELPESLQSMRDTEQLGQLLDNKRTHTSRIYLIKALWKVFGWRFFGLGIFELGLSLINYIPPLLLCGVVSYLEIANSSSEENQNFYSGITYAAGIIVMSFVSGLLSVHCNFQTVRWEISVRGAVMDMVYRKLLRVRACDLSTEMESSQVMNLIGTDCERVANDLVDAHYFCTMPIFVAVTLYLLYLQVGFAFVGGLAFAILIVPVNQFLASWIGRLFDAQMVEQDRRVKLLSECVAAMRVIKLHAWEPYFQRRLQNIRDSEMRHWKSIKCVDIFCAFFYETSPVIILALTFTLYILMGNTLTAAKTFTTISIFQLFADPLLVMPWMVRGVGEVWTSIKRLQQYFALPVADLAEYYDAVAHSEDSGGESHKPTWALKMNDVSFGWNTAPGENAESNAKSELENGSLKIEQNNTVLDEKNVDGLTKAEDDDSASNVTAGVVVATTTADSRAPTLKHLVLDLYEGELIGVVGRVGSGKTSLLMAFVAEMHRLRGSEMPQNVQNSKFLVRSHILHEGFGVALQDVWIQQGTLKENILCCTSAGVSKLRDKRLNSAVDDRLTRIGDADEQRYNDIIDACALRYDVVGALPHGDATEIGEHGVTLSGGQRARIALARACYADKPIVLLDDPLSAVDANVAQHIFTNCVRGLLRNKTVVLVTHHVEFLRHAADRVIVMKDGRIAKCGPPGEVLDDEEIFIAKAGEAKKHADADVAELSEIGDQRSSSNSGMSTSANNSTGIAENNSNTVVVQNAALIDDEEREYGVVSLGVWREFCRSIGWLTVAAVLSSYVLQESSLVSLNWWIAHWTSVSESTNNDAVKSLTPKTHVDNWYYLKIYIALAVANSLSNLYRSSSFVVAELNVARRLHDILLATLMYATQQFYDTTPSGRIINRYGSDINIVDAELPPNIHWFVDSIFRLLGSFVVICIGLPWFTLVIVPVMPWYIWIQHLYRKTSREVQRILTLTRSPVYSWFTESIKGLPHIRAMRLSVRFYDRFRSMLNANQRVRYTEAAASAWLALRLQMVGAVLVSAVVVLAMAIRADAALTGLALSYALSVVVVLNNLVKSFVETEQQMVSVERVIQYVNGVVQEKHDDDTSEGTTAYSSVWPERGEVTFENVRLRYRIDLPYALNGVTLSIKPNEKLAIVGRTGAGKSSMLQALFRTVDLAEGRILIDDVDITRVSLKNLRSRLAIIPQTPTLFDASLRHNIDPLERHSDDEVISAIKSCFLEDVVQKLGGWSAAMRTDDAPEVTLGESGARLSMGERQLVCLARALVSKSKILCLDEATASIDHETDENIQRVLRVAFEYSTVVCIAHRIQTIRDYDRVAVMKDGVIAECDSPQMLMTDTESLFYQMATVHTKLRREVNKKTNNIVSKVI